MSNILDPYRTVARVLRALDEAPDGLSLSELVQHLSAPTNKAIANGLTRLKKIGLVFKPAENSGRWKRTPKPHDLDFLERAAHADLLLCNVRDSGNGISTFELARQAGLEPGYVDDTLAPAVQAHVLLTCVVESAGRRGLFYRSSASAPPKLDWNKLGREAWQERLARQRSEWLKPTLEALPAKAYDVLGGPAEPGFVCSLSSTGALRIESGGALITLPVAHTRQLLHYLNHMAAQKLLATRAPAEQAREAEGAAA